MKRIRPTSVPGWPTGTRRAANALAAHGSDVYLYSFDHRAEGWKDPAGLVCQLETESGCGVHRLPPPRPCPAAAPARPARPVLLFLLLVLVIPIFVVCLDLLLINHNGLAGAPRGRSPIRLRQLLPAVRCQGPFDGRHDREDRETLTIIVTVFPCCGCRLKQQAFLPSGHALVKLRQDRQPDSGGGGRRRRAVAAAQCEHGPAPPVSACR